MQLIEGLLLYEVVLLACGVLLFVTLLIAFAGLVIAKGTVATSLLAFFILPIPMIGFPALQQLKYGDFEIKTQRLVSGQHAVPDDPVQRAKLEKQLDELYRRTKSDETRALVANGYRVIGRLDKGVAIAQSTLAAADSETVRTALVPVIAAKVAADTPEDPSKSPDPAKREELKLLTTNLEGSKSTLTAEQRLTLARAQLSLGQTELAKVNVTEARRLDPKLQLTPAVKRALLTTPR